MCHATTPAPTKVLAIAILPYILLFFSMLDKDRLASFALAPVLRASSADMGTSVASRYWDARPEIGAISLVVRGDASEEEVAASEAAASASFAAARSAVVFVPKVSVVAWPGTSGFSLKRSGSAVGASLFGSFETGLADFEVLDDDAEASSADVFADDDDGEPEEEEGEADGGTGGWPTLEAYP